MGELILKFGINWKILIAQGVNFFILLLLLSRFVYRPLLELLRKRKEEIARGLQLTKDAETKMGEIEVLKTATLQEAREESLKIVQTGEKQGKNREAEIIKEAQDKAELLHKEAAKAIAQEKNMMEQAFYGEASSLVRSALEKVLNRNDISDDEDRLITATLNEVKN